MIEEASSITGGEYAILLASIEAKLLPKKFHCGTCITQYGKSPKMMQKAMTNRTGKGCFDYVTKTYRLQNIKYTTCIGNLAVPIDYFLEAFTLYERSGKLPFSGSMGDQPNKIMEAFDIIEYRRNEIHRQTKD